MSRAVFPAGNEEGFRSDIRRNVRPFSDLGAAQGYALLRQSAMGTAEVFPPEERTW